MIDNEGQLLRMETQIQRVHHAAGAWDSKISFKVSAVVPAKRGHPIPRPQSCAVQSFRQSLGATVKIQIRVTLHSTIGQPRNNFNVRISFWDSLQNSLQSERVIHHGSLHCKWPSGAVGDCLDTNETRLY